MAKFLGIYEYADTFKNDAGEEVPYHNFKVKYLDEYVETDKTRGDMISCTGSDVFEVTKISDDKIRGFMGCDFSSAEEFKNRIFEDIELVFGRSGVVGIRFKNQVANLGRKDK